MKNFEDLAGHSKVWIYQSNKPFNDIDIAEISTATEVFINSWQSHGSEMNASFKVFYNHSTYSKVFLFDQSLEIISLKL
jgi:hypothetical protein